MTDDTPDRRPAATTTATSRRGFLRGAAALGGAAAADRRVRGATHPDGVRRQPAPQVLVVLSMRGAADGLSLVVPHADPVYYQARPSIAVPSDRLLVKDGMFGLHPSLAPLLPMWNAGKVAAVHATGLPVANRSHFSAMEEVEDADPGSAARVGWLNRLVGRDGTGSPIEAVQMGGGVPNAAVCGPEPVLVTAGVDDVLLAGAEGPTRRCGVRRCSTAWGGAPATSPSGCARPCRSSPTSPPCAPRRPPRPTGRRTRQRPGRALQPPARTIRADVGAEIITVDHGSWDHHTWIGTPDSGNLRDDGRRFAGSVAAFFADLGPSPPRSPWSRSASSGAASWRTPTRAWTTATAT